MYAVIRTGGKQYRVAPGDVVKIESVASENQTVEYSDVLAGSVAHYFAILLYVVPARP